VDGHAEEVDGKNYPGERGTDTPEDIRDYKCP